MVNIYEILQRAASLKEETALNSISPERAGGIMYDTLLALNDLWLRQGAALVISKIYASVAAMQADTAPVSDLTGQPLRLGQIVVIASSDSDNGSVYRYNGTGAPSWSLVGTIGNLTPVDNLDSDSVTLPLAAHQGKVLDGKIGQLQQEIDEKYTKPSTGIPASDMAEGVIPDVSQFITRTVNDLANYYLKSETYTKEEVLSLIAGIQQFVYVVADVLPVPSADTMGKIYLLPSLNSQVHNTKDEFITIENNRVYSWEQIGSTAIDLSGYVTTQELNAALANYTTSSELAILLAAKYEKPSSGIPKTDLKQDVQELLSRAGNSVAVRLVELDGTGIEFSPILEPFILVAMNTDDIAVYHVSASTALTPEANIIRLVYGSTSSLLKFYYYDDNVVAWSDGEVSLYYCNLSGSYFTLGFFDGSFQRLEEDGVLLPIGEFATKSDLIAKYEKPSAGIPKSDLASSVQSSLNKADTAYQKPSNGIPDTDMTESVRRCLELADSSATLNRYIIEGGHGLKFVPSTNSYLVRIETENEEFVYLISCGDDYTNTQVTSLVSSTPTGISFYLCGTRLLIWASSASRFSLISLRGNGAIDSEIIDEMPEDVEEIVPGAYATDLDLTHKQDVISDLATIRSGAEAGASAVQPSAIANMERTDNKTTSLSSSSTDTQYPSAKAVYDFVSAAIGGAIDETYPQNE